MSTINGTSPNDVSNFIAACNAASQITNGQITPFEFAFWDEVLFHHSQNFSLAVYIGLPQSEQPAVLGMVQQALLAPDPYSLG